MKIQLRTFNNNYNMFSINILNNRLPYDLFHTVDNGHGIKIQSFSNIIKKHYIQVFIVIRTEYVFFIIINITIT